MSQGEIFFLHGFPLNQNMWKHQKTILKAYRCHFPDLPGSNTNDKSFFTLDMMAEEIIEKIVKVKGKVILCGLSMGGYIAQSIYESIPEKIHSLVLISTRSGADSNSAKKKRTEAILEIKNKSLNSFLENFTSNLLSHKNYKKLFEEVYSISKEQSENGILSQILALQGRRDFSENLKNIKVPCLILSGEDDKLSPPPDMKSIFNPIPEHEFYIIENSGHLSPLENPDKFNSILMNFLKKL